MFDERQRTLETSTAPVWKRSAAISPANYHDRQTALLHSFTADGLRLSVFEPLRELGSLASP